MTKEVWARVEEALSHLYSVVRLRVDGYDVALVLGQVSAYRNVIVVEINGQSFKQEWSDKDCEERRRFFCRKTRALLNPKQKKAWDKLSKASKQRLTRKYGDIDKVYEFFQPYWTSFRALKAHLIKNNASIELVSIT